MRKNISCVILNYFRKILESPGYRYFECEIIKQCVILTSVFILYRDLRLWYLLSSVSFRKIKDGLFVGSDDFL